MAVFTAELQLLSSISVLIVPFLIILYLKSMKQQKPINLPPGPRPLPIIGNLHQIGDLPHRSLRDLAAEHGPLMYVQVGRRPTVVAGSAKMAAAIMKTHDLSFCDRPPVIALRKFSYGGNDIAAASYNETWRQAKKVAVLELFTAKRVDSFRSIREQEVQTLISTIAAAAGAPVNLAEMGTCLFNNTVCREVFGTRISEEGVCGRSKYQDLTMEMIYLMGGFCAGDIFPGTEWLSVVNGWRARVDRNFEEMDAFLEEQIEAHVERMESEGDDGDEHSDFCTILLRLHRDHTQGKPLTRTQIKGILMNMFLGGTETAASTLEWGMAELVRNPRVLNKAREQIQKAVGNKGLVDEGDLKSIPYINLIMKEVYRLHPLSLLPRRCRQQCTINGFDIPVNTTIYINTWAISRDPETFDEPEEFRPERFENSHIDYKGTHFELLPFGAGRRMCPAAYLGTIGLELAIANLLYSFNWDLPDGQKEVDMADTFGLAIHKTKPLILKATPVASA